MDRLRDSKVSLFYSFILVIKASHNEKCFPQMDRKLQPLSEIEINIISSNLAQKLETLKNLKT